MTGNAGAAQAVGDRIVRDIGKGVLDDARVDPQVGAERARVTVSGEAQQILPFLPIPRVSETVEGPVERYVQDTGHTTQVRASEALRRGASAAGPSERLETTRDAETSVARWPSRSSY